MSGWVGGWRDWVGGWECGFVIVSGCMCMAECGRCVGGWVGGCKYGSDLFKSCVCVCVHAITR